jgi:hypothetical protein
VVQLMIGKLQQTATILDLSFQIKGPTSEVLFVCKGDSRSSPK